MRHHPLILILLMLITTKESFSQWKIKYLDETLYTYDNVIKFKNDSFGLFMGSNSVILRSDNTGETWDLINLATDINVKDFQFSDDSVIYAIGDQFTGAGENLSSILIKSSNNGDTWDSITSFSGKQLVTLWFFNNDSGIVAGYDGIYRTVDASISWDTVWSITQFGYKYGELKQLSFPSSEIGYAIGIGSNQLNNPNFDNFLLKSKNSGVTWDNIRTFPFSLGTIHFLNQDTGFIGAESSIILKTMDGGISWNETQISEYYNSVNSIHFSSNMIGFAAGAPSAFIPEGPTSFFISKTINGGDTWESYDTIGIPLNSIYYINDSIGFVSGSFSLIMKSVGGISGLPEDYPWHLVGGGVYIDETEKPDSHIKIYPNPTNGMIWVQQTNRYQPITTIKLITVTGRIIDIMKPISDNEFMQIDLSDLAPGMYLILVTYLNRHELSKVLKK
jgi:photosystem II stability/assembly factor-like uncharacterized protein